MKYFSCFRWKVKAWLQILTQACFSFLLWPQPISWGGGGTIMYLLLKPTRRSQEAKRGIWDGWKDEGPRVCTRLKELQSSPQPQGHEALDQAGSPWSPMTHLATNSRTSLTISPPAPPLLKQDTPKNPVLSLLTFPTNLWGHHLPG